MGYTNEIPDPDVQRNDIYLEDVTADGVTVRHRRVRRGRTFTEDVTETATLPPEFLALFDGGVVAVDDLTAEERAWLTAETDSIVFDEVSA